MFYHLHNTKLISFTFTIIVLLETSADTNITGQSCGNGTYIASGSTFFTSQDYNARSLMKVVLKYILEVLHYFLI